MVTKMEWNELNISQVLRYSISFPMHRLLTYLSIKTKRNFVSKPIGIALNITEKCNLKCEMCRWWRKDIEGEELSESEILQLITTIKAWGIRKINFSGGEPLLRKDVIFSALSLCKEYDIETSLVTNGWLLDENTTEKLLSLGLDRIGISVDGIGNMHDNLRGTVGAYNRAIDAINNVNTYKEKLNKNCIIHLNSVVCNKNLDELLKLAELAKYLKSIMWLQAVHCYDNNGTLTTENQLWVAKSRLHTLDRTIDKLVKIKINEKGRIGNSIKELMYMKEYFYGSINRNNCYAPFDMMSIDSCGNVLPCWHRKGIGNIRNEDIKSIWNSDAYKNTMMDVQHCSFLCSLNCRFTPGSIYSIIHDMAYLPWRRIVDNLR